MIGSSFGEATPHLRLHARLRDVAWFTVWADTRGTVRTTKQLCGFCGSGRQWLAPAQNGSCRRGAH